MKPGPRSPYARFSTALATFQAEAAAALAEAEAWRGGEYDAGLSLGEFIALHRKIAGMSLQEVADRAGVTKAHVWELQNGRARNPSIGTVCGIAKALGVPVMAVFRAAVRTHEAADWRNRDAGRAALEGRP